MTAAGAADDGAGLATWMAQAGVAEVLVVSPHLDDAAFSLAAFLTRGGLPPRRVLTVFTEAGPATDPAHALASGFPDADAEFAARRREDAAAMARLGVAFAHAGLEAGRLDADAAAALAARLPAASAATLVLLPLGAGAERSALWRLGRRLARLPSGSGVHGDHVWVRDRLRRAQADRKGLTGFYAEIPYQWANRREELARLAQGLIGRPPAAFALVPDPAAKLRVAADYASQVEGEFGRRPGFRRRTASVPEWLFLPPAPVARGTATP